MTAWTPVRGAFLGDLDRAGAALFGAKWYQTISGTAGRACGFGGGQVKWWGSTLRTFIEDVCRFGPGHCQYWAEYEQKLGQAIIDAGLGEVFGT